MKLKWALTSGNHLKAVTKSCKVLVRLKIQKKLIPILIEKYTKIGKVKYGC